MKTIKIIALVMSILLIVFFWSDLRGAVMSSASATKKVKDKAEQKVETVQEYPSSDIIIKNRWRMPGVLTEISGLSHIAGELFACVQDELGKIFIYNTKASAIEKVISFADAGDYEGLTIVDETAWVVRADGRLFEVKNYNASPKVKEHNTHLTARQNVEGLCYDKTNNRLLVAIKDVEPGNKDYKGIYSFDLASLKMAVEPVFKINLSDTVFSNEPTKKKKKKGGLINPSAIAIHPVTTDIYITDGPKGNLLIMDKSGTIKKLYHLDAADFPQPEGITFKDNGEMFIANEGSKQAGNIVSVEIRGK